MSTKFAVFAALILAGTTAFGCASNPTRMADSGAPGDAGTDSTAPVDSGPGTDSSAPDGGPTCVDGDSDGYGEGCDLGTDCDDGNPAISPGALEVCDGLDNDCDLMTDEGVMAPTCRLTVGVCAGAVARCSGDEFGECDATDYGGDYEADESTCDGMDNDCDGTTDEGCACTPGATQACGSDIGLCMAGVQTCDAAATWGPCAGETGPMGEVCDGDDNDCDGTADEVADLVPPDCPLQQGVCTGSRRACGGAAGWVACSGTASYGGDYQATETLCDGLDNDCDGVIDLGCECMTGATQACGTSVGACMVGTQTCTAGSWGACAGEVAPAPESCDGVDNDCDGTPDNGVIAPPCALTAGICAGASQPCSGAGGFTSCVAADYGPMYEAAETACDGQDNDCDGTTDEGCGCVGGTTQACGSSVGACTRGTQLCTGGAWGACTGGVEPGTETCNGADDDCNGASDDALSAPGCALTAGVCAGSTQLCGAASGWDACSGTASYGPRYVVDESGATDEAVCDGLDNDCDGTADEGCTAGPIIEGTDDTVLPDLQNQHLVYLRNYDGNWDVVFANLATSEVRRLTTTAASEGAPTVYGNYVTFSRGTGAAERVVLYDLVNDTEFTITTREASRPDLYGGIVVYQEWDGAQWDIYLYDIALGTANNLFIGGTADNENDPSLRGNRLAYVSDDTGTFFTRVIDYGATMPAVVAQTPASSSMAGQFGATIDYSVVGWTDGRFIASATPNTTTDDWDIYAAPFGAAGSLAVYPGENAISSAAAAQLLTDVDGSTFVFNDYRHGDWNPGVATISGTEVLLSTHPGHQGDPTISGVAVMWEDNRLGAFDIYGSNVLSGSSPSAGDLVINEILADPPPGSDVNGDGAASSTQDEFVEIYNVTGSALDLSGLTLSDGAMVRHTFAAGTTLPALGSIVVFGGGTPAGVFGGARVVTATAGSLGLNNGGDTLTLALSGGGTLQTVTYGSAGGNDESLVRNSELDDASSFSLHSTRPGAVGAYSPGTNVAGYAF